MAAPEKRREREKMSSLVRLLAITKLVAVCAIIVGMARVASANGNESVCSVKVRRMLVGGAYVVWRHNPCNTTTHCQSNPTANCADASSGGYAYCTCSVPQVPREDSWSCKVGFQGDGGSITIYNESKPTGTTVCVNYACPYYDECPEPTWTVVPGGAPHQEPTCTCSQP